jgi:hypothetical protein
MFLAFEKDQLTLLLVNQDGAHLMDQTAFERRIIEDHKHYYASGDTPDDHGGPMRVFGLAADDAPVELRLKWLTGDAGMATFQLVQVKDGVLVADPQRPHRPYTVNFALPDC